VIAAINNEDPHDQLKIAYHLILDNRNIVETGTRQYLLIDTCSISTRYCTIIHIIERLTSVSGEEDNRERRWRCT
jgi:hypothetical protein